nr:MAG TPA: hypothetical protein [Caudoviricetes sp.]
MTPIRGVAAFQGADLAFSGGLLPFQGAGG